MKRWIRIKIPFFFLGLDCIEDYRKIGGPDSCQVKPHSKPWMARIRLDDSGHHCGGVLIGIRLVLTAAHCICWGMLLAMGKNCTVNGYDTWEDLTVILGDHDIHIDSTAQQNIKIEYAEPFIKYNGKYSDISKILTTSSTFISN